MLFLLPNSRNVVVYIWIIYLLLDYVTSQFITMAIVGTALASGSWYKWDSLKDNTICRYMECCNDYYVPFDTSKLQETLSHKMFGQPLVNELVNIISAHKEAIKSTKKGNRKALVLSLHGWSGVGKNYAATMIAESLYKKGMESKFVRHFMGEKDFDCLDIQTSKNKLIHEITSVVKKCPTSLIILDEIHAMCPFVLDAIKPMLDHHHAVDNVDYRDSIFVFISNIGGQEITSNLLDLYSAGVKRDEVEFHNFEPIIRKTAFYTGGFQKSSTIAHHLIDHYIPFLPLEQHHVEMCALAEFREHGIYNPSEAMMTEALSIITYGPTEEKPIFANNGCKRFTKHIPYVIQKFKKKTEL